MNDGLVDFSHSWLFGQFILSGECFSMGSLLCLLVCFATSALIFIPLCCAISVYMDTHKNTFSQILKLLMSSYLAFLVFFALLLTVSYGAWRFLNIIPTNTEITTLLESNSYKFNNSFRGISNNPYFPVNVVPVNDIAANDLAQNKNNTNYFEFDLNGEILGTFRKRLTYYSFLKQSDGAIWRIPSYTFVYNLKPENFRPLVKPNTSAQKDFENYRKAIH